MILKLLKNELKASYRMPVAIYAITLFLGVLAPVLYGMSYESLSGLSVVLFIIFTIPFLVVTIVTIAQRFGKNLFGDEGYLMFTLPVKTYELVLAKLVCAIFWVVCGVVVYLLAWILLLIFSGFSNGLSVPEMVKPLIDIVAEFTGISAVQLVNLTLIAVVVIFVETVSLIQLLYFTSTVTNIGLIQKFKSISGVVIFFIITAITSLIIRVFKDFMPLTLKITRTGMEFGGDLRMQLTRYPMEIILSLNDVIIYAILFFPLFFLTTTLIKRHLAMK